ncbi:hypothetical protein AAE478_004210 [Parahypoxylon ruwenzoriense]
MAPSELFTIPIPGTKSHPGGGIVCTSPAPQVYLLTWSSPPDNRLTPAFNTALMTALDAIEFGYPPGVVITTSAISKFYTNGLDLQLALGTPGFLDNSLYPLFRRFLTYPMPTIALLNGHCFAGGLMLAMHHDYRVFTGTKGYACVNELEFGVPLMPPMSSIFKIKLSPHVYRSLVLEAHRFDAKTALEAGLVDAVGELDAALNLIKERALVKKGTTGIYGLLKAEMYRESVALLDGKGKEALDSTGWQIAEKKRKADGIKRFKEWKNGQAPATQTSIFTNTLVTGGPVMASTTVDPDAPPPHPLFRYKYHVLIWTYLILTSSLFCRIYRQPFSLAMKSEQYETIFKGTTLAAVVGGVAMSSAGRAKYRQYREENYLSTTQGLEVDKKPTR